MANPPGRISELASLTTGGRKSSSDACVEKVSTRHLQTTPHSAFVRTYGLLVFFIYRLGNVLPAKQRGVVWLSPGWCLLRPGFLSPISCKQKNNSWWCTYVRLLGMIARRVRTSHPSILTVSCSIIGWSEWGASEGKTVGATAAVRQTPVVLHGIAFC